MTTSPTQPEAILRYILTLDLEKCDIAVCIASGRAGDEVPTYRRISQSQNLAQRFREAIEVALEKYKKGIAIGDLELQEFAADTDKPDNEIEYLDFFPYDSIKKQIEPINHYMSMPHFEYKDRIFISDMRFYVIRVQPANASTPIYFYRIYNKSQMLSELPLFAMWLQKDLYDDLKEPTFLFERHIDCISYEEYMFILQKHNFYRIFNFEEFEKVAREMLGKLAKKDFIQNYNRFKRDCLQDKNKILKLKNISAKTYLDTLTIEDLHNTIKQYTYEEIKLNYLILAAEVRRLYKAILPDAAEKDFTLPVCLYQLIEQGIYTTMHTLNVDSVLSDVTKLVRNSITLVRERVDRLSTDTHEDPGTFDISQIDINALDASLHNGYRHIKAEQLRNLLSHKIRRMIQANKTRIDYQKKLQRAIDRYNEGCENQVIYPMLVDPKDKITLHPATREAQEQLLDELDDALVELVRDVAQEEQRHFKEGLSEEELAFFDILTLNVSLSQQEREEVKQVVRQL